MAVDDLKAFEMSRKMDPAVAGAACAHAGSV